MRIVFSEHARQQMRERNLKESPIREVIQHPQSCTAQSKNRFRVVGFVSGSRKRHILIVVYDVILGRRMEVITAFVTSKVNKYL